MMGLADKYLLICLAKCLPRSWVLCLVNCFVKFSHVFGRVGKKLPYRLEKNKLKKKFCGVI